MSIILKIGTYVPGRLGLEIGKITCKSTLKYTLCFKTNLTKTSISIFFCLTTI